MVRLVVSRRGGPAGADPLPVVERHIGIPSFHQWNTRSAMRLTAYTDITLRILMQLGFNRDRRVTIQSIAGLHGISRNHLMKVVHQLGVLDGVTLDDLIGKECGRVNRSASVSPIHRHPALTKKVN